MLTLPRTFAPKLAKKDLILLYNISYPTLRRWLRAAGLHHFIGRRKFLAGEVVQIFNALGRPRLVRQIAQQLKDIFTQLHRMLPAEERFAQRTGLKAPKVKQDQLPDSPKEIPSRQRKGQASKSLLYRAIGGLRLAALTLWTRKLLSQQQAHQAQSPDCIASVRGTKKGLSPLVLSP